MSDYEDARYYRRRNQQLESGQAPGPCGQQGHLMLHYHNHSDACFTQQPEVPGYMHCPLTAGCILCERQAKLLEALELLLQDDYTKYMRRDDVIEARAAAAIAEETRKILLAGVAKAIREHKP